MSGLDPIGRKEWRDIILKLKDEGKTVFFSTHILPDVEMICDRVGIVVKGKLKAIGKLGRALLETPPFSGDYCRRAFRAERGSGKN